MKQSFLFTKTFKEAPKDEASFNAQMLIRAGFIDKLGAGIYNFLPLGLRVLNKINNIVRSEMNSIGGQEILMSALSPKNNWEKTNRWNNFDALFKINGFDSKEYALAATHEEIISPLMQKICSSYRDLPMYVYQIQTKFRNEKRAKAGLIRGREFLMKDLYSFHCSSDDLDVYYEKVKKSYLQIYKKIGIGDITHITYASGGSFSKYSHEYQTITETGEDIIYICQKCSIAINKEIISEQDTCPECGSDDFEIKKSVEVGNIFKLANKFSRDFNLSYIDQDGSNKDVVMGCYGIGISRLIATIVEVHNDQRGIIWPINVAPFTIHLISLNQNKETDLIYEDLVNFGFEVLYDDRDLSLGQKLNDADLIGCPYRLIISQKNIETGQIEIKKRSEKEVEMIKRSSLITYLKDLCLVKS